MKTIVLLLGISLILGLTTISEAKKPNPANENIIILPESTGIVDCPCPVITDVSPDGACLNKGTHFTTIIDTHGYTEIRFDSWTVDNGTVSNATKDGADVVFTQIGTQYHHIKISGKRVENGVVYWDSVGVQNFAVTVFELEKIIVEPKKVIVEIGRLQNFTAKVFDIEGNDVTQYIADKIYWSVEGGIGKVIPTSGNSTTFIAVDKLPGNKAKMSGRVVASITGIAPSKAIVTVIDLKVSITGRNFVLCPPPWPGRVPKQNGTIITLEAKGIPYGGEYLWTIAAGSDKIRFVGPTNTSKVKIEGIKESGSKEDVEVMVTYTIGISSCFATHKLTVRRPAYAAIDGETPVGYQAGFYYKIVTHQLEDQFGDVIKFANIPIGESVIRIDAPGIGKIGSAFTDENGEFKDKLQERLYHDSQWYQIIKAGCRRMARLLFGGWDVGQFNIIFKFDMQQGTGTITKVPVL